MDHNHAEWTPLLLSIAASAPLALAHFQRSSFPGFGHWFSGNLVMCIAALGYGLSALALPVFQMEALVGNLLLLSYLLYFTGCHVQRSPEKRPIVWTTLLVLLWIPLDVLLSTTAQQPHLVHLIRHLIGVVLLVACVWTLLSHRPPQFGSGDITFASVAGLVAAYHLLRIVAEAGVLMPGLALGNLPSDATAAIPLSGFKAIGFSFGQLVALYDRKAWEARQAENERREFDRLRTFETFFEHAPVPLVFTNRWSITMANEAFRRLFGLPLSGPLETNDFWRRIVPDPQDRQAIRSALDQRLFQLQNPGAVMPPMEFRLVSHDNTPLWVVVTGRQLRGGVLVSVHHISGLRQLQAQLRESEERHRHAMAASRDGIWDWCVSDNSVHFDGAYMDMLGQIPLRSDHNGLDVFLSLLHPEDRDSTLAFIQRNLQDRESFEVEFRMRHREGHDVWVLSRGMVVERDCNGAPVRVVGTHTDITERKALELHRKAALEQQRTLLQAAPLGICAIENGTLVQCNARMYALFADLPVMLRGCSLFDLIREDDLRTLELQARASGTASDRSPLVHLERPFRLPDGNMRWLRFHGQSISGKGLWHDGIVAVEDVTEARRMTDELIHARDAADSAARATQGLLANLRHEVNTPLHAILGFSELLDMPDHNDMHRQAPAHIRQAALQLQAMLGQLHDLAAAHAQPIVVHEQPLDLPTLCRQSEARFREAAQRKGLQLRTVCDRASKPLQGDAGLLQKAIEHLLTNAMNHTARGTIDLNLQLDCTTARPCLRVEVSDSGCGVPDERRAQLFKPFVAGDFSDARTPTGMGIGLSEVQRIAQALHGEVYYRPRDPQGSVFGFTARLRQSD